MAETPREERKVTGYLLTVKEAGKARGAGAEAGAALETDASPESDALRKVVRVRAGDTLLPSDTGKTDLDLLQQCGQREEGRLLAGEVRDGAEDMNGVGMVNPQRGGFKAIRPDTNVDPEEVVSMELGEEGEKKIDEVAKKLGETIVEKMEKRLEKPNFWQDIHDVVVDKRDQYVSFVFTPVILKGNFQFAIDNVSLQTLPRAQRKWLLKRNVFVEMVLTRAAAIVRTALKDKMADEIRMYADLPEGKGLFLTLNVSDGGLIASLGLTTGDFYATFEHLESPRGDLSTPSSIGADNRDSLYEMGYHKLRDRFSFAADQPAKTL